MAKLYELDRFGVRLYGPGAVKAVAEIQEAVDEARKEGRDALEAAYEYAYDVAPYNHQVWALADALEQDVMGRDIGPDEDDALGWFYPQEPAHLWAILRAAVQASVYSIYRACWTLAEEGE